MKKIIITTLILTFTFLVPPPSSFAQAPCINTNAGDIQDLVFDFGDVLSPSMTLKTYREYQHKLGIDAEEATSLVQYEGDFGKKAMEGKISFEEFLEKSAKLLKIDMKLMREMS